MTAGPEIRPLTPDDAAAFLAVRLRSLREHPEAYHSTAEDWDVPVERAAAMLAENVGIGVFEAGRLSGLLLLATSARHRVKLRHKVEIWSVYVAPEARGRGYARALVARALQEARARGYEAAMLSVNAANPSARAVYEALGFRAYGTEPRAMKLPDGRVFDDVLMQCDLREG